MVMYEKTTYTTQNLHVCKTDLSTKIANYSFQYKMLLYQNGYIFFDPPCNNYSNVNIDHDNDKKVIIGKQREQ